ncbi:MAG TPA: S41 family peptidase [Cytophagales bacterium]|nr:S41 family peptidase [Cytophagales bacterium]
MKSIRAMCLIGAVGILILSGAAFKYNGGEKYFEIAKNLDIFATLFKETNTYYVDEINPNQMIRVGIDAMLADLDPYTNFIPEDEIEDFRTMTTGEYGGIGALISKKNGKTLIVMPYKGYSAHKSGLRIGDEIVKIDGVELKDRNANDIGKLLKGQANSTILLTIKKYGSNELKEVPLKREIIKIDNVPFYGMVDDEIGYIKLSDFTSGAWKEVKEAASELKSSGAKRLILDVRDNPGGILMESVNICNLFIPKDLEVVTTKGKIKELNRVYSALNTSLDTEIPMAVLTSNMSASAAEIVAGVIQDYDRGVLIGQKTYGKGLVQTTRPLSFNSHLKITTQKYYIPSGRCIQAIDYSHRNEDGSIGKIPDSLRVAFKTKNGRVVYDGGGITPDIELEKRNFAPITLSLISKGLLFDYATKYSFQNKKIASAKTFRLSDEEFQKFVNWLSDKQYDYTSQVELTIDELIAHAKNEKNYEDISDQIVSLKSKLSHNKESDVQKFKDEIKMALEEEIVSRYYLQDGVIEASFDSDPDILAAIDVLKDSKKYDEILRR